MESCMVFRLLACLSGSGSVQRMRSEDIAVTSGVVHPWLTA